MIRLIVSDMDGTLLSHHEGIHPDNIAAICEAQAQGVTFAVASGRTAVSCGLLLKRYGLMDAYIIGVNGCQTVDRPFGNVIETHYMDKRAAAETMRIFDQYGLGACLYTEHAIVYTSQAMLESQESAHAMATLSEELFAAGMHVLAGREAIEAGLRNAPMKAFCVFRPGQEEAFAAARRACDQIPGVELTSSWTDNFEVMPAGVDKGRAVAALAKRLGIAREDVAAFGDSDNDIPMLRWAGTGLAMENAQPPVKRAADGVVAANVDGGVAQGIWRLLAATNGDTIHPACRSGSCHPR